MGFTFAIGPNYPFREKSVCMSQAASHFRASISSSVSGRKYLKGVREMWV